MDSQDKIKEESWKDKGFDKNMSRSISSDPSPAEFIKGENFDILLDDLMFNRIIRFRNLSTVPQGNEPGKTYWDADNKKLKIWVDSIGQWCDINYTSTSTSTTSTSTSSTSTSTTSTSTSSTSTSTT